MLYRLNIGREGILRINNETAHTTDELLTIITNHAQYDDVVQVTIIEELAALDGFGPELKSAGTFASYYNGTKDLIALLEIFHCSGRGIDLHNELNRLAKEQRKQRSA